VIAPAVYCGPDWQGYSEVLSQKIVSAGHPVEFMVDAKMRSPHVSNIQNCMM
jgi:hypothetical protein